VSGRPIRRFLTTVGHVRGGLTAAQGAVFPSALLADVTLARREDEFCALLTISMAPHLASSNARGGAHLIVGGAKIRDPKEMTMSVQSDKRRRPRGLPTAVKVLSNLPDDPPPTSRRVGVEA
jgi:hypothetical protein